MENHDKIFEKIKNASLNQEHEFPSMEKVWSRVESKLDNKVLKKQNQLWKKIAVAASFLLVFTVSYQIFKPAESTLDISIPKNEPAAANATNTTATPQEKAETSAAFPSPTPAAIRENESAPLLPPAAEQVTDRAETLANTAAVTVESDKEIAADELIKVAEPVAAETDSRTNSNSPAKKSMAEREVFDARSVKKDQQTLQGYQTKDAVAQRKVEEKSAPLIVIDGKAVTAKNEKRALREGLSKMDPDDVENIVVLKEPLYIINGQHYSEQQLFGPNPTSPYHPLSEQEIESLSILQGEKAIAAYGKKGEKGVVIIATKNGKPKTQPRKE